jgi:hypothetical protein
MRNDQDSKLWWMPFEVAAWLSDPALRQCSIEARGVWIDMLCVMWKNSPQGYFVGSAQPDFIPRLSRLTGVGVDRLGALIEELRAGGVFSTSEGNEIYSRRMVKEAELRAARSRAGRAGGQASTRLGGFCSSKMPSKPQANVKQTPEQTSSKPPSNALIMTYDSDSPPTEGGPGETAPPVSFGEGAFTDEQCDSVMSAWNTGAQHRLGAAWAAYKASHRDRAGLDYRLVRLRSQASHAPQDSSGFAAWLVGQIEAYWRSSACVSRDAGGKMFTCTFRGFVVGTTEAGPKCLEDPDQWGDRKTVGVGLTAEQSAAKRRAEDEEIERKRAEAERARAARGSVREAMAQAAARGNPLAAVAMERGGVA